MHVQDDHRYIYMHVRACHDTVHEYIYGQEHIMCSLYIQTLPQLEVYKQSTDGDMHAIGRYFISEIPCMQVIVNFCDLHIYKIRYYKIV